MRWPPGARKLHVSLVVILTATVLGVAPGAAHHGSIRLASVSTEGIQASGPSANAAIAADGGHVVFTSWARDLVPDDTGWPDIFVHDLTTAETERVSVSSSGVEANGPNDHAAISADGRYVAFESAAGNLIDSEPVRGPFWIASTIYVHDRLTGQTIRGSVTLEGDPVLAYQPQLSSDGRSLAFWSKALGLVPEKTDRGWDVFVRDLHTGHVSWGRCGRPTAGSRPSMSLDARWVAYTCQIEATLHILVLDRQTGEITLESLTAAGVAADGGLPALSLDGAWLAFASVSVITPDDTNARADVFVRNRITGDVERVSVSSQGDEASAVEICVNTCIYKHWSSLPAISSDGRFVAFASTAENLVPWDTNRAADIFLHDRQTGITQRISVSNAGQQANNASEWPTISADGRLIVFSSLASNLVRGDTNDTWDVFVVDVDGGSPTCDDTYEEGRLSGPIHETIEPEMPLARDHVHKVSCEVARRDL